jgi:hypothetical protein
VIPGERRRASAGFGGVGRATLKGLAYDFTSLECPGLGACRDSRKHPHFSNADYSIEDGIDINQG